MQTICTSLQTDNHTNTSSLIFIDKMLFLTPNQQCQKHWDCRRLCLAVTGCAGTCRLLSQWVTLSTVVSGCDRLRWYLQSAVSVSDVVDGRVSLWQVALVLAVCCLSEWRCRRSCLAVTGCAGACRLLSQWVTLSTVVSRCTGCAGSCCLSLRGRRRIHLSTPGVDQRNGRMPTRRS